MRDEARAASRGLESLRQQLAAPARACPGLPRSGVKGCAGGEVGNHLPFPGRGRPSCPKEVGLPLRQCWGLGTQSSREPRRAGRMCILRGARASSALKLSPLLSGLLDVIFWPNICIWFGSLLPRQVSACDGCAIVVRSSWPPQASRTLGCLEKPHSHAGGGCFPQRMCPCVPVQPTGAVSHFCSPVLNSPAGRVLQWLVAPWLATAPCAALTLGYGIGQSLSAVCTTHGSFSSAAILQVDATVLRNPTHFHCYFASPHHCLETPGDCSP